jgi:hypothetical protein
MKARALLFAVLLTGCASSSGGFSRGYEMAVPQADAPELASAVTDFVTHQAQPAEPVVIEQPKLAGGVLTVSRRRRVLRGGEEPEEPSPPVFGPIRDKR